MLVLYSRLWRKFEASTVFYFSWAVIAYLICIGIFILQENIRYRKIGKNRWKNVLIQNFLIFFNNSLCIQRIENPSIHFKSRPNAAREKPTTIIFTYWISVQFGIVFPFMQQFHHYVFDISCEENKMIGQNEIRSTLNPFTFLLSGYHTAQPQLGMNSNEKN